jgi:hypothetical protein
MTALSPPAVITYFDARATDWIWAGIAMFIFLILRDLARKYRH